MSILTLIRRFVLMSAVDGDGAMGGAAVEATSQPAVSESAPSSPPVTPVVEAPAIEAPAPAADAEPTSMLEAIDRALQPRDEHGRFTTKAADKPETLPKAAEQPKAPEQPKPAAEQPKPGAEEKPPEGLSPGAQQRFQQLANEKRELAQRAERAEQQVSYVRDTFQQHGIRQDQFEQAATVIGMMNRGDYVGAQRVLTQQLQQIALMTGKPIGQVDALDGFPDLRQQVDGLQLNEERAIEIARARQLQQQHERIQQEQQRAQAQQQAQQQATQQGTRDVDAFCKQMAANDIDYPAIEQQLLPVIGELLKDVPPTRWKATVETNYRLMKQAAAAARASSVTAAPTNALRATGPASPSAAPKSMFEAMWGAPRA